MECNPVLLLRTFQYFPVEILGRIPEAGGWWSSRCAAMKCDIIIMIVLVLIILVVSDGSVISSTPVGYVLNMVHMSQYSLVQVPECVVKFDSKMQCSWSKH